MKLIQRILELLFPEKCILCRSLLGREETDLCRHCRETMPVYTGVKRNLQFLDSFAAVWYYEKTVRSSLLRYKFYGARNYAPGYGRLLAMRIRQEHPDGFDLLTWIPVSRIRRFFRGYDQVELLALAVGRELEMKPVPVLKKVRHNPRQSGIRDAAKRRANVMGVYQVRQDICLKGKQILLLDDILTTGATASEAGRMLLTDGAEEVHCAVMAAPRK